MVRRPNPNVVALCGSLRDESRTRIALNETLDAARDAGAQTELVDLREYELPALKAASHVPDAAKLRATVECTEESAQIRTDEGLSEDERIEQFRALHERYDFEIDPESVPELLERHDLER